MSNFLLDMHAFLWWVNDSPKLSAAAREIIADTANECLVSFASCWEIAIKCSIGKLQLTMPVRAFISYHLSANQFRRLAISFEHVTLVETLPLHHRDPFDRLLIAQAMTEDLDVISADTAFDQYKIRRKWR